MVCSGRESFESTEKITSVTCIVLSVLYGLVVEVKQC